MAKKKKASKVRTVYRKAKKSYTKKRGGLGIGSLKELVMTAVMLTAGKVAVNAVAPGIPFQRGVSAIAGGGIATVTGLPGKKLITYGIADAGSDVLSGFLAGKGFSLGGNAKGGYDW